MVEKLTEMEKDFLKEMTSIATANVSALLSKKIGHEITFSVPSYNLISHGEIKEFVTIPKGIAVCAFVKLRGDVVGSVLLVFSAESAFAMADLLQKRKIGTTEWPSGRGQEKLLQMGNSMLQCYLKAITDFVDIDMRMDELRLFSPIGDAVAYLPNLTEPVGTPILALRNDIDIQKIVKANVQFLFFLCIKDALSLLRNANLRLDEEEKR